jgi:hypothetical protein
MDKIKYFYWVGAQGKNEIKNRKLNLISIQNKYTPSPQRDANA